MASLESFPSSFIDEPVQPLFDQPPLYEKTPPCPDGFIWREQTYRVLELLEQWTDYQRRGRMARNMRPEHAERALQHGSWGVGRFFFRVKTEHGRIFELYYDRAPGDADDRKGHWILRAERTAR